MAEQIRTFIAVNLSDELRAQAGAVQQELRTAAPAVKWVDPQGMHFTLKFLGGVDAGLIDRITTMRGAIDALKQRAGLKRIRLVVYRRPSDYRPNYYARAPQAQDGDIRLLNIDLPSWLANPMPQFMYLWAPGLR